MYCYINSVALNHASSHDKYLCEMFLSLLLPVLTVLLNNHIELRDQMDLLCQKM